MKDLTLLSEGTEAVLNAMCEDMIDITDVFHYSIPEDHAIITAWKCNREAGIKEIRTALGIAPDEIGWSFYIHDFSEILSAAHTIREKVYFVKPPEPIELWHFFANYVGVMQQLYVIDNEGNIITCDYGASCDGSYETEIVEKCAFLGRFAIVVLQ